MKKNFYPVLCMVVLFTLFFGACGKGGSRYVSSSENERTEQDTSGAVEDFPVKKYQGKFLENRTDIRIVKENYRKETEEIKEREEEKISYTNCLFADFPDIKEISVLQTHFEPIGVEEGIREIKKWLKEIGQEGIDLKKELRYGCDASELDETKEYPYCYPAVYENKEKLEDGSSFFINTKDCHVQMAANGFYSMSDGTIKRYLGLDEEAGRDIFGTDLEASNEDGESEGIIAEGKFADMREQSYELLKGKVRIGDAAEIVKKHFEKGTPYPPAGGVGIDVPVARVYRLKDKYCYGFLLRRTYEDIPFSYSDFTNMSAIPEIMGKKVEEDIGRVFVADDHVCAFVGMIPAERIEKVFGEKKLLDFKDAVKLLEKKLAPELRINMSETGLEYCPCRMSEEGGRIMFPVWKFEGQEQTGDRSIHIFMDALTGEVSYYISYPE